MYYSSMCEIQFCLCMSLFTNLLSKKDLSNDMLRLTLCLVHQGEGIH